MIGRHISWFAAKAAALVLMFTLILGPSTALAAGRDRTPPTKPTNLRVTAKTSFSVSLAWNPSADNSGSFTYRVHQSSGYEATVSQSQTSYTWTSHLEAGYTYSFYVYAVDGSGNKSGNSNTVTVTLPRDTTPPTAPVLSATDVGPTHVSLTWTPSTDDGPFIWYQVFVSDGTSTFAGSNTSATVLDLDPSTTYVFTVQARDNGINWSPPSNAVTVTTEAPDPNDTTPPTPPTNLIGYDQGCGEADLRWTASTDNVDPQFTIRYEIVINGVFLPENVAIGYTQTIVYALVEGSNTFEIYAVDSAGNRSTPASLTLQMSPLC
jgi:chitodextrinase